MWYPSAVIREQPLAGHFGFFDATAVRSATVTKACGLSTADAQEQEVAFLAALVADPARHWPAFLDHYSGTLLRIISRRLLDEDDRMEAYVYVCEKLAAGSVDRIRRYTSEAATRRARFATWLAAVVRNLCVDWLRTVRGRRMLPTAVERMSLRDQAIFRLVFWDGRSYAETVECLSGQGFPGTGLAAVGAVVEAIHAALPTTSLWSALVEQSQHQGHVRLDADPDDEGGARPPVPVDTGDSPEAAWRRAAVHDALNRQLATWSAEDRLLLSLRYDDELRAREIATLVGAENEAAVYQRLRSLIDRLRRDLRVEVAAAGRVSETRCLEESRRPESRRGRTPGREESPHGQDELP